MAKYADYEVLGRYLAAQKKTLIPMTFSEVAKVVGRKLPNSAKYPAWWSNDPSNNPMTRVWLKAGFKTEQVDIGNQRLIFRHVSPPPPPPPQTPVEQQASLDRLFKRIGGNSAGAGMADGARVYSGPEKVATGAPDRCRHPLYGALKGHIRLVAGTDLTEPADAEWGNRVWGDDTK